MDGHRMDREQTGHHSSSLRGDALYIEETSDRPRPVVHQVEPHAFVVGSRIANSTTVIANCKRSLVAVRSQTNCNLASVPMLNRVIHSLASDVVKMCGDDIVIDQHGG